MVLAWGLAALTALGAAQVLAGWMVTIRFAGRAGTPPIGRRSAAAEPITILKPLHGDEPLLADALATACEQDYPPGWQIVCGVQDRDDPAIAVVRTLQARYPALDLVLIVDPSRHGTNPKVGNLINMLPAARHDLLVISDSDVHMPGDFLRRLVDALADPGVGLATTLYTGRPARGSLASALGSTYITHCFLPGALLARALGRHECLGATMCLRRETLARIGGLEALKDHLADDNVLGALVRAAGLDVALAGTVVATTVAEQTMTALWRHELRWARTIRTLAPAAFAVCVLQYPLFPAALTILASGGAEWSWMLAVGTWAVRAAAAAGIDRALRPLVRGHAPRAGATGLAFRCPLWLVPVRDILSAAEWIVSHAGRRVDWRGQALLADTPPRLVPSNASPAGSAGNLSKGSTAL